MTIVRCMALCGICHQFKKLWKFGSTYVLGVTSIFTVFSGIFFCCSVIFILGETVFNLSEALPFFFLMIMINLSKTSRFTRIALNSSSQQELRRNIAKGMSELGPALTLDSLVELLAIGIGALSGVKSLENISLYAGLAGIVNYFVFMTFFPSCLSLALELRTGKLQSEQSIQETEQKPNPALQRVKMIMSAGLMVVHAHCRWTIPSNGETVFGPTDRRLDSNVKSNSKDSEIENLDNYFYKWFNINKDQLFVFTLTFALVIRYIFYENHDDSLSQITTKISENKVRKPRSRTSSANFDKKNEKNHSLDLLTDQQGDISTVQLISRYKNNQTISLEISDESVQEAITTSSVEVQTEESVSVVEESTPNVAKCINLNESETKIKDILKCLEVYRNGNVNELKDEEIIKLQAEKIGEAIHELPFENYDYGKVAGACCENVIGYMPVPVGMAGPMLLDDVTYHVPMATTEGCLVASTNRGFRALLSGGGIRSKIVADGMSRAPVVRFSNIQSAAEVIAWLNIQDNFQVIKSTFDSTSRFSKLQKLHVRIAGRYLYIRFVATTGDAMGMNMVSKAVNWIEGRGKSVVCEAVVPENIVKSVLKTNVQSLVDVNISKNLIGSSIAGSIGGCNAQAANIVAAIFIATGQDPAQVVGSSNCITLMEPAGSEGKDLYITVSMPCLEVGTIGGGTMLPAQAACLKMLGVQGPKSDNPGENAKTLATIVCGTVLAGELSLLSALSSGHLVRSHMRLNRSCTKPEMLLDSLIENR
ncbi:3-hydroxy-3-methylglutaryl-coenzyme A reductase [Nymphon striatum]|nr:3-hydroxy-3-methylglutaryl-coenzyme A reductase [Nymphon striatum]